MTTRRKTGVSHLHNQQPTAVPRVVEAKPQPVEPPFDRVFEPGTHHFSDESGEYTVDPETGKVIRKL